jgi:hypothetical protein
MMLSIGTVQGGPEIQNICIGQVIRRLTQIVTEEQAACGVGPWGSLNVVYHIPGRITPDVGFEGLRDATFSRTDRLLMIQVAVPHEVAASEDASDVTLFLIDSLRQANALAARYFKQKAIDYSQPDFLSLVDTVEKQLRNEAVEACAGILHRCHPPIDIDLVTYGPELDRSALVQTIRRTMSVTRQEAGPLLPEDTPSVLVAFHVSGSQGHPRWEGLRHASISRDPPVLLVMAAVPESMIHSDSSLDFVIGVLQGAHALAFDHFQRLGIGFPLAARSAIIERIKSRAIELGSG